MHPENWPNRTFWNWVKWNFRGRPTVVVTKHCRGTIKEADSEQTIFVPDYLLDDWWKLNDGQRDWVELLAQQQAQEKK